MDEDVDVRDEWVDGRLRAAMRDAQAVPRRRLVLPAANGDRRRRLAWVRDRPLVVGLLALNTATGAAVVALGLALSRPTPPPAGGGPSSAPAAQAAGAVSGVVALDMTVRGDATRPPLLALAAGSVWVPDSEAGAVLRVDERSLRVTATIRVALTPGDGVAVAGEGSTVWAAESASRTVVRIDPATDRVVDTVAVGFHPGALAVDGDRVWVAGSQGAGQPGRLVGIDAPTHRVVLDVATGRDPREVVAGRGAVWVVNHGDGTVTRLDTTTGGVASTAPTKLDYDYGYVGLGVDASGALAVDNNRSVLERIDPVTLAVGDAVAVGGAPDAVAVGGGAAWSVAAAGLTRVDLGTGRTAFTGISGAGSAVAGDGSVWVLAGDRSGARIVRVSPA